MTSQFFSHGFAIYVTWTADNGTRGVDQFGNVWTKRGGYAYDENNIYKFKLG
jgi:hypothetical protein